MGNLRLEVRLVLFLGILTGLCCHAQPLLIPYQKKDRWGYADSNGNLVIPARYKSVRPFDGKIAVVNNSLGRWGFINRKGDYVGKPKFYEISEKTDGVYYVTDSLHTWADANGQVVSQRFNEVQPFVNGAAVVKVGRLYGLIRKNGRWLFKPQYERILHVGNAFMLLERGDSVFKYYDTTGKHFLTSRYQLGFSGRYSLFVDDKSGRINFMDRSGKRLIPEGFVYYDGKPDDYGVIVQEVSTHHYGIIGNNGTFTLPPVSKMIRFYKPFFVFERDSVYDLLIPHTGRIIRGGLSSLSDYYCLEPQKDFIIMLKKGNLRNLVDSTGHLFFDRYYEGFDRSTTGTWTQAGDTFTWKDTKGSLLLRQVKSPYTTARAFDANGYSVVLKNDNGKWTSGLIDLKGNEVLPCRFERLVFDERMKAYLASDDTSTARMDLSGKSELWLNAVARRMPAGYFVLIRPLDKPIALGNATITGRVGLADSTGRIIVEPVYGLADRLDNRHFVIGQSHLVYESNPNRSCSFPSSPNNWSSKVEHTDMQIIDDKGRIVADIPEYCQMRDGFFYFPGSGRYMRQDGLKFYEE